MKKILFLLIWTVQMVSVNSFASDPAGSNAKPGVVVKEQSVANPAANDGYYIEVENEEKSHLVRTPRDQYNSNTISLHALFTNWDDNSSQPMIQGLAKAEKYTSGDQQKFLESVRTSCGSAQYHDDVKACVIRFMKSSYQSYVFTHDLNVLQIIKATCSHAQYKDTAADCFINAFSIKEIARKYSYIKEGCGDQYLCYVQFIDKISK